MTISITEQEKQLKNIDLSANLNNNAEIIESDSSRKASMIEISDIPCYHRRCADGYMIIRKIFGFPVVQCSVTEQEKQFLVKYNFNPLEFSTSAQVKEEIETLKKWGKSYEQELRYVSNKIVEIRVKELKNIIAKNYRDVTSDVYNGYKVFENYLKSISKYSNE